MAPRIESHQRLTIAGLSFFGDPFHTNAGWTEENEIGRLWQRLFGYLTLPDCPYPRPEVYYEVHLRSHATPMTGEFEVFVGFEVPGAGAGNHGWQPPWTSFRLTRCRID